MRTRSEILALLGLTACGAFRPDPEASAIYGGPPTRPEIVEVPTERDTDEPEQPPAAIYGQPDVVPDAPTRQEVNDIYGAPRTQEERPVQPAKTPER